MRPLILKQLDSNSIRNAAAEAGFEPLRYDGAMKVLEGITSVEEVLMVTHEDF